MSDKPIFHAGKPGPALVYAYADDIARKNEEITRLRATLHAIMQLSGENDLPNAWTLARAALEKSPT